jgi:PRTRC genetic system protein E
MSGFFELVHKALRENEPFKFQISREGDLLSVMVQPLLGPVPESLEDDDKSPAAQARAALATPLLLRMSPSDLDDRFGPRLAEFNSARGEIDDSYKALIDGLNDSSKAARNAVQAKKVESKPASGKTLPKPKGGGNKSVAAEANSADDGAEDGGNGDAVTAANQPALPLETTGQNPASIL